MSDLMTRIRARALKDYDSALYALHPELTERIPLLRVRSDDVAGAEPGGFVRSASYYERYAWVHKAIKVIADNVAPLELRVVQGSGDEEEVVEGHELTKLLTAPNEDQSSGDIWRQWVTDMMLGGEEGLEAVWNVSGNRILELWPRQPHTFTVRPIAGGRRYRQIDHYKIDDGLGEPYALKPEQFIHLKFYNPSNPWRGIAPITAIRSSVIIDQLAQAWSRLFFKNQARPDYAIIAPEGVTEREKSEILLRVRERVGHAGGWHEPLVLEQGITDIKTYSWPPKDVEWLAQQEKARDEVAAVFGVPDEIMGYGRDTYENFGTAMRVLWSLTIVPLVQSRDIWLTRWFSGRRVAKLEPGQRIRTDLSRIPELQEDKTSKVEQYTALVEHGVPLNMASETAGLKLPPLVGGDTGYMSIALVPVTEISSRGERSAQGGSKALRKWRYGQGAPEFGSDEHKALLDHTERRLSSLKDRMRRDLKRFWQRQQNEVTRRLRNSQEFGRGLFTEKDRIPPVEQLFDIQLEIQLFQEGFGPHVRQAIETTGTDELARLGLEIAFDVDRPEVIGAFRHILETHAEKTQKRVFLDLIDIFEEAETEGEGVPAIMERLSAFYGDLKSDYQVERIARTTLTPASNIGALEAWAQSGVVGARTWISALQPGRTRPTHEAAHGQTVGLREMFTVGGELLMYPGDPNGSPENIINCLCSTAPVVEE